MSDVCGSCGRYTSDGRALVDREEVLAYMCGSCWDDFMGSFADDINEGSAELDLAIDAADERSETTP